MTANTTAGYSVAIGYESLKANTTGSQITAVGYNALGANTTGNYNVAVGAQALESNTPGANNVAVGLQALEENTGGSDNTAIGHAAGSESLASENTAVGSRALELCTTGANSTAVGKGALQNVTTGSTNTGVGRLAGNDINSGTNNLCLGGEAGRSNSPSGAITTGSNNVVLGNNSIQNLYCADTSISSSDARDKTDVTDFTHGLSWIKELRPVTYRWDRRTWYGTKENPIGVPDGSLKRDRLHIGFLAQEFMEVEKKHGYAGKKDDMLIVNQDEDEANPSYGIKYERLVPVLVNAIKELEARLSALEG